jgi:hypothetical protein
MLAACRGAAEAAGIDYPRLVYPYLEKQMSLAIPIATSELCRLAKVSRAGFYRWKAQAPTADPDMELRDEIQRIALEFSYYGSRRVTRELRERDWQVNRKNQYAPPPATLEDLEPDFFPVLLKHLQLEAELSPSFALKLNDAYEEFMQIARRLIPSSPAPVLGGLKPQVDDGGFTVGGVGAIIGLLAFIVINVVFGYEKAKK